MAALCAFALSGCLSGSIGCADGETLDTLERIVEETMQQSGYGRELGERVTFEIRGISTVGRDRDTNRSSCEAELEFVSSEVVGGRLSRDIEYEVYPVVDDDYDFMVESAGIDEAVLAAAMAAARFGWPQQK
ncbi:hypothetical protein LDO31_04040 [Luteimonas sp. XNQY3]|nr:hypothetical protein [Luteimonas sp. XNQY3]MCD9005418.1 hypothetical protein [Luteimonas sp. XNQY3]